MTSKLNSEALSWEPRCNTIIEDANTKNLVALKNNNTQVLDYEVQDAPSKKPDENRHEILHQTMINN